MKKFRKQGGEVISFSYLCFFFKDFKRQNLANLGKKKSFIKPQRGGGHRFMKLFRKIEFFLMMAFLTHDVIF